MLCDGSVAVICFALSADRSATRLWHCCTAPSTHRGGVEGAVQQRAEGEVKDERNACNAVTTCTLST